MRNQQIIDRLKNRPQQPQQIVNEIHVHVPEQPSVITSELIEKAMWALVAAGCASAENCLKKDSPAAYADTTLEFFKKTFKRQQP